MSDEVTIEITEVGPRDGLQNEPMLVATDQKIAFINALSRSGLRSIEVSSFVSPKWVPQLADAEEVFASIDRCDGVTYSALVPNEAGLARALALLVQLPGRPRNVEADAVRVRAHLGRGNRRRGHVCRTDSRHDRNVCVVVRTTGCDSGHLPANHVGLLRQYPIVQW